jgi:hypothetical protein
MTNQQIKEYLYSLGSTSAKLHDLELALYKFFGKRAKQAALLKELHNFVDGNEEAIELIINFSDDNRTDIREVSASLVNYLWKYWKDIKWDFDDDPKYHKYNHAMKAYADKLSWTLPLIEKFLGDKAQNPIVVSLYNIWELEYVPKSTIAKLRKAAVKLTDTKFLETKRSLVRTLVDYYPSDEEARSILDDQALQFYVNSTYDPNEQVRDWALFELHLRVGNLNDAAAKAFLTAFDRESPESEAHVEAAIGMARMGLKYERLIPVILDNLAKDSCGTGWLDAAEYASNEEILLALIDLYKRIVNIDSEDTRLDKLEILLYYWNDI